MRRYLLLLITTLLLQPFYAAEYPKREIRAVWIMIFYSGDWPKTTATNEITRKRQQQELCDKLDMLQAANFNTVFLQVRLRGDVIYPSAIEPINKAFAGKPNVSPGYDPLAFAIEECHKRGLECHAWFVTYPLGEARKTAVKTRPELCKFHDKEWYLDPSIPGTADYLLSLVKELVMNYDIDGIQFDYIRYPDKPDKFPDKDTYARYANFMSLADWRRDNITRLVTRIYDWVKQAKPWVQVSSTPLGKYNRIPRVPDAPWTAYETVYQDPQLWLKLGKHDMVAPMMYYKHNYFYPFVDDWAANTNGRLFISGLGTYRMRTDGGNWSLLDIVEQIEYLRRSDADGIAFYRSSEVFDNYKGLYTVLKDKYFKYPAMLPPLTWLSKERPEAPLNVKVEKVGKQLKVSWRKPAGTSQTLTYTVYYSVNGTVNPNRAENILTTGIRDTEVYLTVNPEIEQEYSFRVTASSRYHIESRPSREVYYYYSRYSK